MMETEEEEGEGLTLDNKRVHNNTHPAVTEEEGDGGVGVDVDPGSEEEEEAEDYPGQEEEEVEGEEEGEAGKGRIYVTSNGRNVNRDGCSKPALLLQDGNDTIVLDLVSAPEEEAEGRKCLFQEERLARDSRVSSAIDHGAGGDLLLLNGFTESPEEEEEEEERRIMASLEGGEGGKGEDGVAGTAKEAGMAPPPAVPSSDMDHSGVWAGEDGDGDRDTPCADGVGTESVTSLAHALLPCEQGKHPERNCAGGGVESLPVSDMTLPNGDVDDLRYGVGPGGDTSPCKQHRDALLSDPRTNSESEPVVVGRLCDVDGKEIIKLANGGLHLPNVADATRDHPSSSSSSDSEEYFSQNKTNVPFDVVCVVQRDSNRQPDGESPEESVPAGSCVNSQGGGDKNNHRGESNSAEPPAGEEEETVQTTQLSLPPSSLVEVEEQALDPSSPSSKEGPPTPDDLSAKPPSSCPSASTLSNLTSDSHGTEPSPREEEGDEEEEEEVEEDSGEGYADFSLPTRPQTLRTKLPSVSVSLSCDATPLSPEEGGGGGGFYFGGEEGFEPGGRRQSAPDNLSEQNDASEHKLMPKRFGIADFFTRSLFTRKAKEPKVPPCQNATGWRLFGKTSKEDPPSPTAQQLQEDQLKGSSELPCSQRPPVAAGKRRNLEFEPLSTTALILEDRPPNLPAKCLEEAQRHKQEYEEMVAGAKRREMKEAQKKKRQMKERYRQEESIAHAIHIWNNEILPHWDSVKGSRRVRDLWWNGLPPSVRGRVWSLAIANELNITPELYEIFLSRAKEKCRSYSETSSVNDSESEGASLADRESSLDLIKLDISRTFPSLFIFQKGGPYHDLLHSILGAYTCYRPDIGYVQGMSFIAAVLILNLEEAEAFITFANLLNKPCQMAFFRVDHELMLKYFAAFEVFFEENLPHLFNHFQTNSLTPDLYLIDWIFTLYSKSLPLDVACRVWDVFCRDGEESLFRTGLGILRLYEEVLLQMDFIHIAQFLSRLPEDLASDTLFTAMANTHMVSGNRRWGQVFSALMKDANKEMDKSNYSPALRS